MAQPVTIQEAARQLSVSADTVRRRIRKGALKAFQDQRPQGYQWLVELPAVDPVALQAGGSPAEVRRLEEHNLHLRDALSMAREELAARRREVQQLLTLLQRVQPAEVQSAGSLSPFSMDPPESRLSIKLRHTGGPGD